MNKKHIFALAFSLGLAGCSMTTDNRTMQTALSDDPRAAYLANNALRADKDLVDKGNVSVTAYNQNLLLVGQVPTEELRDRAGALVHNVKSVKRIYNQIVVQPPIGGIDRSKDAVITSNLKAHMLTTTDLKSSQFKVVTEDGTVYLMGLSTHDQADKAVDVIRHSPGVKKVVKLVEYVD